MSYSVVSFRRTSWQRSVDMATKLLHDQLHTRQAIKCVAPNLTFIIWPYDSTVKGYSFGPLPPKYISSSRNKSYRRVRVPEYDAVAEPLE